MKIEKGRAIGSLLLLAVAGGGLLSPISTEAGATEKPVAEGETIIFLGDENYPEAVLVVADNYGDGFDRLLRGEIDTVVANTWAGYFTLREMGIASVGAAPEPLTRKVAKMAVAKGNLALLETSNAAIGEVKGTGEFDRIIDKWSGKHVILLEKGQIWIFYVIGALAVLTLVLLATLLYLSRSRRKALKLETLQRERATAALRESEAKYRGLVETSQNLIWQCDREGRFTYLSPAWEREVGYAIEDMLGRSFHDFQAQEVIARDRKEFESHLEGGAVAGHETIYISKSGDPVHLIFNAIPLRDAAGEIIGTQGTAFNITERKAAERALMETEDRFRVALKNSPTIVCHCDTTLRYTWINQTMPGYAPDGLLGKRDDELLPPEDAEDLVRFKQGVLDSGIGDRREIELRVSGARLYFDVTAEPLRSRSGEVVGLTVAATDVTARKAMEQQLIHAQKMEAIGQLTGGVAHDFNNMLQVILTNIELARFSLEGNDEAQMLLGEAFQAGERGAKLIRQLLAFSRRQSLRPEAIDPNDLIGGMLEMLGRTLGEDIEVVTCLDDDNPPITVDPNALETAILNLVMNARMAMPDGGKLIVRAGTRYLGEDLPTEDGDLPAGHYVEIALTDTGCGMSLETLERVLEPFFTTRDVGEGSGLGLSMVYGFAKQSGGHLTLESEVGKGTTVTMLLPVAEAKAAAGGAKRERVVFGAGSGTVLVVEDDPYVRSATVATLAKLGYDTREAEDGPSALEILRSGTEIDLLFADVVMPKGMSGFQLAREASWRHEGLKVLLASGYSETELEKSGLSESSFRVLKKPYSNEELSEALTAVLEA